MGGLLYREDIGEVRKRLNIWWKGGDIGRPAMMLTAPRTVPLENIPKLPEPPGWITDYSIKDFEYRINLSERACINTHYLGEEVPVVAPDIAPGCLAVYLGCDGMEGTETFWSKPFIDDPEKASFEYDPKNLYWDFTLRLAKKQLAFGKNKFLLQFPDLIEGLDTLAAMRGTQELLIDMMERPDWVHRSLKQITGLYFQYYDILYDKFKDETGGSYFWAWAPGRMSKFQCDFSAMISPAMFEEFMVPVLTDMCEKVSHSMYHWDGPGAVCHHDLLLGIPGLDMLQWIPGEGQPPAWDKSWWNLYHKTFDAGKKIFIDCDTTEDLKRLKKEFGGSFKQFLIMMSAMSLKNAEEILEIAGGQ